MEHGDHINRFLFNQVKDRIGKAANDTLPHIIVVNDWIKLRMPLNPGNAGVNRALELRAQTFVAFSVPLIRLREVELRLRLENNLSTHSEPAMRCLTSAQVEPLLGFLRCASRRRSSSSRCAWDGGAGSDVLPIESQISSTSWIRSETLSSSTSVNEILAMERP